MHAEWKTLIEAAGAVIESGGVRHFGNPSQELQTLATGTVIADLSHTGLIAVRGPDAATFLQNQFSNDVRGVSQQHSQMSAYCNPKGRILACFRIFMRDDTYYLRMPQELVDATLKRLRMFVLRAKVTLEDAGDALVRIGIASPHGITELKDILGGLPEDVDDTVHCNGLTVIRLPGAQPRFEITGEFAAARDIWNKLGVHATPVGASVWDLLDIRAGIPTIHVVTSEAFVPQMVNLHLINGVSFKKGCYPGQEIVARMHYLGTLKRRMYLAHILSDTAPQPGDTLYGSGTENTQSIGTIVTAQPAPEGGFDALAVVEIKAAEHSSVHLHSTGGAALAFRDLPYPLSPSET
ncbi:MAG: folate-binding protein YgfZ [Gammaproteobacteria bacterium]